MAIGTAIVLGLGLFRERKLRQSASTAEQLAQARLSHAQEARDAAEKLVSEAVLGLHDKLVPIGKISILEDLATAAEDYYAKLPADLVSDVTRRHEVWIALNRAIIADASSDDDAKEAACRKALALVRELSVKSPDDETLRGDEFYALIALASLLYGEERHGELVAVGGQLGTLSADWLRRYPQSAGALRAKLAALCVSLLAHQESDTNPAAMFALFAEAQGVAEQLKKIGGETMETRVIGGLNTFANGLFMWKLHNTDAALKRFAEADAAFSDALGKTNGHPFIHELLFLARRWSLLRLADFAQQHGDAELEKEVYRQVQKLIADLTALAEFEPARLERWRQLGWLYLSSGGLVRTLEGESARQAWVEKGIATADRAVAPKFDRPSVRRLRSLLLGDLSDSLATSRPAGWPLRVIALLNEMDGILLAPSKSGPVLLYDGYLWQSLNQWNTALAALGDDPAQREIFIAQAGAEAASAQRVIGAFPTIAKFRLDAVEQVGKAAELLRRHGCPEATELEKQCARWRTELDEKFADDLDVIRTRAWQAKERGLSMLGALRAAPAEEKAARFGELEKHLRAVIANLHAHQAQLSEYDATMLQGECLAFLGEAQLEQGQFAVAEDTLRAALAMRSAAAAKAPNPDETVYRRWVAADSQGRLGLAIFKQGREEDGRKLRRTCAETMADLAKQAPTIGRLRNVVLAWRSCAELFPRPEDRTERIALLQKSAEAAHAMLKFAKTATSMNENESAWNLGEANWTLLHLGWNLRDAKDLPASEAALREGIGYATENLAHTSPADFPERAEMRVHLRYDLALTLLAAGRTDEAREQVEQITKEIHQVEQATAPDNPHATTMRHWIEQLATLLPNQ